MTGRRSAAGSNARSSFVRTIPPKACHRPMSFNQVISRTTAQAVLTKLEEARMHASQIWILRLQPGVV